MRASFKQFLEGKLDKPTLTVEQLAKRHGVAVSAIQQQLTKGIKVEKEHTSDAATAKEIALDHLKEDPKYYDKLKKMEESTGFAQEKEALMYLKMMQRDVNMATASVEAGDIYDNAVLSYMTSIIENARRIQAMYESKGAMGRADKSSKIVTGQV